MFIQNNYFKFPHTKEQSINSILFLKTIIQVTLHHLNRSLGSVLSILNLDNKHVFKLYKRQNVLYSILTKTKITGF